MLLDLLVEVGDADVGGTPDRDAGLDGGADVVGVHVAVPDAVAADHHDRVAEVSHADNKCWHSSGRGSVEHRPLPQDDPVRRKPNIDRAREVLGWTPTVSLDEGLERTVAYFREAAVRCRTEAAGLMRIYLAWQYITGYSTSGMHELVEQGHDVRLMYQEALVHPPFLAPFDDAELTEGFHAIGWSGQPDEELLMRELDEFQPDVLIVNSWHIPAYMKAARAWRGKALRIVVMDHQWLGTPKQWLGRLTRRLYIQPAFDAAFMPGDEQAVFARHLGFKQHEIIVGLYTCDGLVLHRPAGPAPQLASCSPDASSTPRAWTFSPPPTGPTASKSADPWPLVVAGIGPMDEELAAIEGVELLGFVRPTTCRP